MRASLLRCVCVAAIAAASVLALPAQQKRSAHSAAKLAPGEYATFVTDKGSFVVQLFPKQAPKAVANFVGLAEGKQPFVDPSTGGLSMAKFYNGLLFFRSVPGQFIQTGDQLNNGTGKLGYTLPFEKNDLKFDRAGRVALAQSPGDPTSRNSQIFFTLRPLPSFNSLGFLIIGQIVRGLNVATALAEGPRRKGTKDQPQFPSILRSVTIQEIH